MRIDHDLHLRVRELLYSLAGITLQSNKEVMITNRLDKLKRTLNYDGDISDLISQIEKGKHTTVFINTFTTNKTNFFRESFHFDDLKDRVMPQFKDQTIQIYCSASSTGEEPYSIAMTAKEYNRTASANIIATDIDTEVLQEAANGIYRYDKSAKEFPQWINPSKYFKKRVNQTLIGNEILIKVNNELKDMITFAQMNLSDETYPFEEHQFDVIFCRNVLIYFSVPDQNIILKKLFFHLKIGGTLYIGHSEHLHDLIKYTQRVGQNIFVKLKDFT